MRGAADCRELAAHTSSVAPWTHECAPFRGPKAAEGGVVLCGRETPYHWEPRPAVIVLVPCPDGVRLAGNEVWPVRRVLSRRWTVRSRVLRRSGRPSRP